MQMNDRCFVADLPDELLENVFLLNTSTHEHGYDPYRTTISTILVCKLWYTIGSNYPVLWSRVIDYERHSPDRIQELLRRSQSSLIDVGTDAIYKHVRLRAARGKTVLEHIFNHSSNLRLLNLQITYAPWGLICERFLQHPAPNLKYLKLDTSCPFPDCLFPDALFANKAPNLRRVHLQRCLVDFSSSVLHNLYSLTVMDILAPAVLLMNRTPSDPLKIAPTVRGWLRILENIPSLRILTLIGAISLSSIDKEPLPVVELPNLVFLTVGARFYEAVTFLEHLSILHSCGVRLRITPDKVSTDITDTRLLHFLSSRLSFWPRDAHSRYLQAKIVSGDRIHFGNSKRVGYVWDMTDQEIIDEHASYNSDPLLWLVLSFDNTDNCLQFFNRLLTLYDVTYPTTTTFELWIDEEYIAATTRTMSGIPVIPPLDILRGFSAVKTLDLLGSAPAYFLRLLQAAYFESALFIFPALHTLRLTRTNFEEELIHFTLLTFLNWRTKLGVPLAEVHVVGGNISSVQEQSLEKKGNVRVVTGILRSKNQDILASHDTSYSDTEGESTV